MPDIISRDLNQLKNIARDMFTNDIQRGEIIISLLEKAYLVGRAETGKQLKDYLSANFIRD